MLDQIENPSSLASCFQHCPVRCLGECGNTKAKQCQLHGWATVSRMLFWPLRPQFPDLMYISKFGHFSFPLPSGSNLAISFLLRPHLLFESISILHFSFCLCFSFPFISDYFPILLFSLFPFRLAESRTNPHVLDIGLTAQDIQTTEILSPADWDKVDSTTAEKDDNLFGFWCYLSCSSQAFGFE